MWMWSTGINRNIVECKEIDDGILIFTFTVLIETLWNVKYYGVWRDAPFYVVLIETLWNVKVFLTCMNSRCS